MSLKLKVGNRVLYMSDIVVWVIDMQRHFSKNPIGVRKTVIQEFPDLRKKECYTFSIVTWF